MTDDCAHCTSTDYPIVCVKYDCPDAWVTFKEHFEVVAERDAALGVLQKISELLGIEAHNPTKQSGL